MMADTISSDRRSKIMSHIKSKDTSIEMMVRRRLFAMGYRYRVNYKALPGNSFMGVIGTGITVEAGTPIRVSQTKHIGALK